MTRKVNIRDHSQQITQNENCQPRELTPHINLLSATSCSLPPLPFAQTHVHSFLAPPRFALLLAPTDSRFRFPVPRLSRCLAILRVAAKTNGVPLQQVKQTKNTAGPRSLCPGKHLPPRRPFREKARRRGNHKMSQCHENNPHRRRRYPSKHSCFFVPLSSRLYRVALTMPIFVIIEADPIPDQVLLLSQEIYTSDLLQILSLNLYRFEFEAKKDFTSIFNTLLRRQVGETRFPTVEYLAQKGEILLVLTKGYPSLYPFN